MNCGGRVRIKWIVRDKRDREVALWKAVEQISFNIKVRSKRMDTDTGNGRSEGYRPLERMRFTTEKNERLRN